MTASSWGVASLICLHLSSLGASRPRCVRVMSRRISTALAPSVSS